MTGEDMVNLKRLHRIIGRYVELNPDERKRIRFLLEVLESVESSTEVFSRSNSVGHITASALVFCPSTGSALLVKKPAWSQHLQPGGHILEQDESPLAAAKRHLSWRLDNAFAQRLEYSQCDYDPLVPADIDLHSVPASEADGEPAHSHFDFRYIFLARNERWLSEDTKAFREHSPRWHDIRHLKTIKTFDWAVPKLQKISTPQVQRRRFFGAILAEIGELKISALAVAHIIPDIPDYLRSLRRCTNLLGVVAKPKSIDRSTWDTLTAEGFNLETLPRDSAEFRSYIQSQVQQAPTPVALIDIGGWFANQINDLSNTYGNKFIGVVEDTENGLQKYESLDSLPVPVFSAARSPLKEHEDFLIGQSIVFSADALLREYGSLLQYGACSILGYGKIGSSIAHHLTMRGIRPNVFETDPQLQLKAFNHGCRAPSWNRMLAESDVLFSATGSQALKLADFRCLKNGCFVVSVTSSDDEFDFTFLHSEYSKEQITPFIQRLSGEHNYFHLVNNGNAANFIHGAVVGEFIHLVRSEMLWALAEIAEVSRDTRGKERRVEEVRSLDETARLKIVKEWLKVFAGRRWQP